MLVLIFPCLSNHASNPCAIILVGRIFSVRKTERLHNISAIRIGSRTYRACHYRSFPSHDRLECTASPLMQLMSFNTGLISVVLSYPMDSKQCRKLLDCIRKEILTTEFDGHQLTVRLSHFDRHRCPKLSVAIFASCYHQMGCLMISEESRCGSCS
jgi:hypothetical protein